MKMTNLDISIIQTNFTRFVTNLFQFRIKSQIPKTER